MCLPKKRKFEVDAERIVRMNTPPPNGGTSQWPTALLQGKDVPIVVQDDAKRHLRRRRWLAGHELPVALQSPPLRKRFGSQAGSNSAAQFARWPFAIGLDG